jgi:hypothetical protein
MPQRKDPDKTPQPKRKTSVRKAKIDVDYLIAQLLAAPRFPAGKQRRSLQNLGLLYGGKILVLPDEDPTEYEGLVNWWIELLEAEGAPELFMASSAAHACWRLRRLQKAEAAIMKRELRRAGVKDHEGHEREAAALGSRLAENPPEVVQRLRETVAGCRWLISQWRFLDCMISEDCGVYPSQQMWATQLLGLDETGPQAYQTWIDARARDLPGRKESTLLREAVSATVAELEAHGARLTEEALRCWWEMQAMRPRPSPEEKVRRAYHKSFRQVIRRSIQSMKTLKDSRRSSAARSEDD